MLIFRSQYIEQKIREKLNATDNRNLTPDDLQNIIGLQISNSNTNITACGWYGDGSAYQMASPNLFLNYNEFSVHKGWEDDLRQLSHIQSLYCHAQVPPDFINSIGNFSNLTDLTLMHQRITDWSFLSGLLNLRMVTLYQCGSSGNEAVRHLCSLYAVQQQHNAQYRAEMEKAEQEPDISHYRSLSHIAAVHMDVSDLTPLNRINILDELDLSHNKILDVSPLSNTHAYYLILRHNKIEDISPLNLSSYMLNLRHNRIRTVKPIIDRMHECSERRGLFSIPLARLFINYNPIPGDELQALGRHRFVAQDFIRDDFACTEK